MTDERTETEDGDRADESSRTTRLTAARRERIRKLLLYQDYIAFCLKQELLCDGRPVPIPNQ